MTLGQEVAIFIGHMFEIAGLLAFLIFWLFFVLKPIAEFIFTSKQEVLKDEG